MQRIKMKTLINILVVLVVAYVDFGCSKKSKTYYISDTTKEYFSYQKGSYWIYSNDSTSQRKNISHIKKEVIGFTQMIQPLYLIVLL